MQSMDRNHRIGQTRKVMYTELVVPNTVDQIILARLKSKKDVADLLTDRARIVESLKGQLAARLAARS
jgi:SNF2 family DNA or RNA helicase